MNLSSLISRLKEHSTYPNYEYTKLQNTARRTNYHSNCESNDTQDVEVYYMLTQEDSCFKMWQYDISIANELDKYEVKKLISTIRELLWDFKKFLTKCLTYKMPESYWFCRYWRLLLLIKIQCLKPKSL